MEIINEKELIDLGYLKKTVHENGELFLYNYTNKAQFDKAWEQYPQLLQCRGLILDIEGNVIARPFSKFFNIEEVKELPRYDSFEITDKLDGSLIIVSFYNEEMIVSTRGSFNSDQAIKAKELLADCMRDQYYYGYTFLFELVGKGNRIVVNYEEDYKLVLLTIAINDRNSELHRETCLGWAAGHHIELVKTFDGINDFRQCRELLKRDNAEGFVVKFDNGLRVKLKYVEYVKLHALMTNISTTSIWEVLKDDIDIEVILKDIPDELMQAVKNERDILWNTYAWIVNEAKDCYQIAKQFSTRKEQSIFIESWPRQELIADIRAIVYKMLDNKPFNKLIWKIIKPKFRKIGIIYGKME